MLAASTKITMFITDLQTAIDITVDYVMCVREVPRKLLLLVFAQVTDIADVFLSAWGWNPTHFSSNLYNSPGSFLLHQTPAYLRDPTSHFLTHSWLNDFCKSFWVLVEENLGPVELDWRDALEILPYPEPPPGNFLIAPYHRGYLDEIAFNFFKVHNPVVAANPAAYADYTIYNLRSVVESTDWFMFWNYFYLKHVERLYPNWRVEDIKLMKEVVSQTGFRNAFRRWYFYVFEYRKLVWHVPVTRFPKSLEVEGWFITSSDLEARYREWYFFNFSYAPVRYHSPVFPVSMPILRIVTTPFDRLHFLLWYFFNSPEVRLNPSLAMGLEFVQDDGFIPVRKLMDLLATHPRQYIVWNDWIIRQFYWDRRLSGWTYYTSNVDYIEPTDMGLGPNERAHPDYVYQMFYLGKGEVKPEPYEAPDTEYVHGLLDLSDWFQWNSTLLSPWVGDRQEIYFWSWGPEIFENDLGTFEAVPRGATPLPKDTPVGQGRITKKLYNYITTKWEGLRRYPQVEMVIHGPHYTHSKAFAEYLEEHLGRHKGVLIDLNYYKKHKPTGLKLLLSLKAEDQYYFWNRYYMHYIDNRREGFETKLLERTFWDLYETSEFPFTTNYFKGWYFINIVDSTKYLKPGGRVSLWSEVTSKFEFEYFWSHYLRWEFFNFRWPLVHDFWGRTSEDFPLGLDDIRDSKSPWDEIMFLTWYFFNFISPVGAESPRLFSPTLIHNTLTLPDYGAFWAWVERLVFTNYYDFGRYAVYDDILNSQLPLYEIAWEDAEYEFKLDPQAGLRHYQLSIPTRVVENGGGDMGEADVALRLLGPDRWDHEAWKQEYRDIAAIHGTLRKAPVESIPAAETFEREFYSELSYGTRAGARRHFGGLFKGSDNLTNFVTSPRVHPHTRFNRYPLETPGFAEKLPKFGVDPSTMFSKKRYVDWTPTYKEITPKPLIEELPDL